MSALWAQIWKRHYLRLKLCPRRPLVSEITPNLLTLEMLSLKLGERCRRVVVVAIVVVVSMMVVDMSDTAKGVADVVSVVTAKSESPTRRRFPST